MSFENWTIEELFARCTDYDDGSLSMDKEEFAALRRMIQGAENAESLPGIKPAPALDSVATNSDSLPGNSPVIPDGWVMVPVEPTAEMISSGIAAHYERSQIQIHDRPAPGPMEFAYVAMLAAAPQQEVK